jgi:hypothetical protein
MTVPAAADMPPEPQTVPQWYPVDQQTYERLKDQANAAAAADAVGEEAP